MTSDARNPKQDYPLRVDLEVLGRRLRQIRESRTPRLSREDVCSAVGLSMTTLVEIEKGVTNPTIDTLMRIVMALGIKLAPVIAEAEAVPDKSVAEPGHAEGKSGSTERNRQHGDNLTSSVTMPFDTLHGASLPQQRPEERTTDEPPVSAESASVQAQALVADILIRVGYAIAGAGEALGPDGTVRQGDEATPRRRRTDHVSR